MKFLEKVYLHQPRPKKKQYERNSLYNYIGNEAESINTHTLIHKQGIFIEENISTNKAETQRKSEKERENSIIFESFEI